jgi:lysophospholipase L1-like esterase
MRQLFTATFAIALLVSPVAAQDGFFFQPKDRVLFLGDSITEQYQYSSTIELYLTTRFPDWNMTFLNAGIGGDTAGGGASRFQRHVLDEKPTAVTINFGMNDGGYGALNPKSRDNFAKNTENMLAAAKKAGVRVALLSPNAVDRRIQDRFKLYLETQKEFYAPLKALAEKYGDRFVDQYAITRKALEKMEQDGAKSVIPYYDGFHTSSNGGLLMAHAILTGLDAPALVSDATIDAAGKSATAKKAKIEKLTVTDTVISFERTDEALPMPIAKEWSSLLPYVNELKDLNWYGLKVTGLPAKEYQLTIDGKDVAKFTATQLAEGVNLGNLQSGPIFEKGQKVFAAINDKNKIVHGRFRGVVMAQIPEFLKDVGEERRAAELAKRLDTVNQRQAEIYQMVRPTTWRYELKAIQ